MVMSADEVYGLWIPKSTERLLEQSETVFVGTVTMINELEFERSNTIHLEENGVPRIEFENYTQTLDEYTVNIEEFLKNPQESNTITMLEATVGGVPGRSVSIGGFELGDRVLFFVPNIDGTNQYSPESFEIPKQCDAKSVLGQPRIFLFNDFKMIQDGIERNDNFVANKPIEFVYHADLDTLNGSSFDVDINIRKITDNSWNTVFDKQIHTEIKPCEWAATASWQFVPNGGRHSMQMHVSEEDKGEGTVSGGFTVKEFDFPLKQLTSGMPVDEIQCNNDLVLLKKHNGSPACVQPDSVIDLIKRNWLTTDEIDGYAIDYDGDVKHLPFADVCTNEMKIILLTYSNISLPEEHFVMDDVALPSGMNQEDFERCAVETDFTKERWNMAPRKNEN